jgi:hypothetical protein
MTKDRSSLLPFQFKEGYYAFSRGWIKNNYKEGTDKAKEWQRGFDTAYFHNLDKIEAARSTTG